MTMAQESWPDNADTHPRQPVPELSLPDNASTLLIMNNEEDEEFYYLQTPNQKCVPQNDSHHYLPNSEHYLSTEEPQFTELVDATFDLANRTFYATCSKLEQQTDPRFRRGMPYSFLENWQLHSMYSKAQQVLLGVPAAQPKVLLVGDDLMFTPPMTQQEYDSQVHMNWDEDEIDYEQDTVRWTEKDGVIVMTAPTPEKEVDDAVNQGVTLMMDENAWMSNRPKRILQVVNPDQDDQDDDNDRPEKCLTISSFPQPPMLHKTRTNSDSLNEHNNTISSDIQDMNMSPELIDWYRSSQQWQPPIMIEHTHVQEESTSYHDIENDDNHKEEQGKIIQRSDSDIRDGRGLEKACLREIPLADKMPSKGLPVVITIPNPDYGTLSVSNDTDTKTSIPRSLREWVNDHVARTANAMSNTVIAALEMSETLANQKDEGQNEIIRFVRSVFRIWQILALGTESILLSLLSDLPQPRKTTNPAAMYSL